ncbi:MAG TPA: hypothetical protein VFN25_10685, partial [Dokdonella sp.]|nr:hypothetical protein [Dokdonella sp.]
MIRAQLIEFATRLKARWPILSRAPAPVKRLLHVLFANPDLPHSADPEPEAASLADDYAQRLSREQEIFNDQIEVHDLPEIFHYWSNTHLRPQMEQF